MNFSRLSNFQLYSIMNSRHLDAAQKAAAASELEKRMLTPDERKELADEFAKKMSQRKPIFKWGSGLFWLVLILIFIVLLKQGSCRG